MMSGSEIGGERDELKETDGKKIGKLILETGWCI